MEWTADLAYAVGLITTDGCLSKDGRHIILVSKDIDLLKTFRTIFRKNCKISHHSSSYNPLGSYYHIQFSDVHIYRFLLTVGLTPAKTKTIGELSIPRIYFPDFLRGHLDGDGTINAYWDKRWPNSYRIYTTFVSASYQHMEWLQEKICELINVKGVIQTGPRVFQLKFAKKSSTVLLQRICYDNNLICLERKRSKIMRALSIISGSSEQTN